MQTSLTADSRFYQKERLPGDILLFVLDNMIGKDLGKALPLSKEWNKTLEDRYGKDGLKRLLQSDMSGSNIYDLWEEQKALLGSQAEILSFKEYVNVYLTSLGVIFSKENFTKQNTIYYLRALAKLPQFMRPTKELLVLSIKINNWTLCRDILLKAFQERKDIQKWNEDRLKSEVLSRIHLMGEDEIIDYYDEWIDDVSSSARHDLSDHGLAMGVDHGSNDMISLNESLSSFLEWPIDEYYYHHQISQTTPLSQVPLYHILREQIPFSLSASKKWMLEGELCEKVLTGNLDNINWLIKEYKGVLKWGRLKTMCNYLLRSSNMTRKEIANADRNLCYLFASCNKLSEGAQLKDLLILAASGFIDTIKFIATSHRMGNPWVYIAQQLKHKEKFNKIKEKIVFLKAPKLLEEFLELAVRNNNFLAIYNISQSYDQDIFIETLLNCQMHIREKAKLRHWQLIVLNQLVKEGLILDVNKYFEKIIADECENISQLLLKFTTLELESLESIELIEYLVEVNRYTEILYTVLYDMFANKKYPDLFKAVKHEKQKEVLNRFSSIFTQVLDYELERKHRSLVNFHQEVIGMTSDMQCRRDLTDYFDHIMKLSKDRETCVEIDIGFLRMSCALPIGLACANLTGSLLIYKQIYKQIYALGEESSAYNSLIRIYESSSRLLEDNDRNKIPNALVRVLNVKHFSIGVLKDSHSLIKNILEEERAQHAEDVRQGLRRPSL